MRIKLRQDHINRGKRPDEGAGPHPINLGRECPLALCLSELTGMVCEVDILEDFAMVFMRQPNGKYLSKDLPKSCKTFIERWDNHKTVDPFSFNMDL